MRSTCIILALVLGPLFTVQSQSIEQLADSLLRTDRIILPNWNYYSTNEFWTIPQDGECIIELNDSVWVTQIANVYYLLRCDSQTTAWAHIVKVDEHQRPREMWFWHGVKWEATLNISYPKNPFARPLEFLCHEGTECQCGNASQGLLTKLMASIE